LRRHQSDSEHEWEKTSKLSVRGNLKRVRRERATGEKEPRIRRIGLGNKAKRLTVEKGHKREDRAKRYVPHVYDKAEKV